MFITNIKVLFSIIYCDDPKVLKTFIISSAVGEPHYKIFNKHIKSATEFAAKRKECKKPGRTKKRKQFNLQIITGQTTGRHFLI